MEPGDENRDIIHLEFGSFTFEFIQVFFIIVWAPGAAHAGDDGEEEDGGGGAHQHPYHHGQPLHLLLQYLVLLSAAELVSV